jgi:hypothetical protein
MALLPAAATRRATTTATDFVHFFQIQYAHRLLSFKVFSPPGGMGPQRPLKPCDTDEK